MSNMEDGPIVVFIDDHIEELTPLSELVLEHGAASSKVYSPADIDNELLAESDLVVVDYTLDAWINEEDTEQISLQPINGIALTAVLRQHAHELKEFPPVGFALITGQAESLGNLPAERRPHIISRLFNLEWFFEKAQADKGLATSNAKKIVSLATAIKQLPLAVNDLDNIDALLDLLGVTNSSLEQRLRDSVLRCRPPIHHMAERSHGLMIITWLLHRILPHTAFLMNNMSLAARLRTTPEWIEASLSEDSLLFHLFSDYQYKGLLHDFDGVRWWRDGVEQLLWDITSGKSSNTEAIHTSLTQTGVEQPPIVEITRPVVTIDHNLVTEPFFSSVQDTVALHLDDWPAYAEPAYARKEMLEEHPDMKIYVLEPE